MVVFISLLTNCIRQSPSWIANSYSNIQEILSHKSQVEQNSTLCIPDIQHRPSVIYAVFYKYKLIFLFRDTLVLTLYGAGIA